MFGRIIFPGKKSTPFSGGGSSSSSGGGVNFFAHPNRQARKTFNEKIIEEESESELSDREFVTSESATDSQSDEEKDGTAAKRSESFKKNPPRTATFSSTDEDHSPRQYTPALERAGLGRYLSAGGVCLLPTESAALPLNATPREPEMLTQSPSPSEQAHRTRAHQSRGGLQPERFVTRPSLVNPIVYEEVMASEPESSSDDNRSEHSASDSESEREKQASVNSQASKVLKASGSSVPSSITASAAAAAAAATAANTKKTKIKTKDGIGKKKERVSVKSKASKGGHSTTATTGGATRKNETAAAVKELLTYFKSQQQQQQHHQQQGNTAVFPLTLTHKNTRPSSSSSSKRPSKAQLRKLERSLSSALKQLQDYSP